MAQSAHQNVRTSLTRRSTIAPSTVRVSINSAGLPFSAFNTVPMISGNGRYMVFTTSDNLTPGSATVAGSGQDVYVKDLLTGSFELISGGMGGQPGNQFAPGSLSPPVISADGRFVVFDSSASNLVPGDTNREQDLFVRDRLTGTTSRISIASDGSQLAPNTFQDLYRPSISADGRFVAFLIEPSNIVTGLVVRQGRFEG